MASIINDSKPISYDTIKISFAKDVIQEIVTRIKAPVAVLNGDELCFYMSNPEVMFNLYNATFTYDKLITTYLDIPNKAEMVMRLHAYSILQQRHRKEFFEIFNELKYSFQLSDIEQILNNTSET